MGALNKLRIATHIEVEWLADATAPATCPNCGFAGEVRQYLDIDYRPPDAEHHFILQICPHCGVRFTDNPETMDYATEQLIEIGWHVYQIQIGAGVWPITAPLTRIDKPAGARLLEIGGAYGFGLDFGIRARGWTGEGFDPSPLAAFGARELGLAISQDYFTERDLARGPYDIVMATEVIEHLAQPPAFFALMRRAVAADGILLLTTPDAAWITPDLSAGALMPLLSPGAHIVLQTAESLTLALRAAGFAHVEVRRESMSLVAYASPAFFTLIEDAAARRALFRGYLLERSALTTPATDLRLGFAGRGLFEAVNDADAPAADTAWAALLPAVQARFCLGLETMTALPAGAETADLAGLARLMPLGLGMILFGRAMQLLGRGAQRPEILPLLRLAHDAAAALQTALGQRSLSDGLSASIVETLRGEIAISMAAACQPDAVAALAGYAAQDGAGKIIAWRGFIELINAAAHGMAADLQTAARLSWPEDVHAGAFAAMTPEIRQDALAALLLLEIASGSGLADFPARIALLEQVRMPENRLRDLRFAAFGAQVNHAAFGPAATMLPLISEDLRRLRQPYAPNELNLLFAAGIQALGTENGQHQALTHFARLRDDLLKRPGPDGSQDALFWPALRGEMMALKNLKRAAEAEALLLDFAAVPGMPDDLIALLPEGAGLMQRPVP